MCLVTSLNTRGEILAQLFLDSPLRGLWGRRWWVSLGYFEPLELLRARHSIFRTLVRWDLDTHYFLTHGNVYRNVAVLNDTFLETNFPSSIQFFLLN